MAIDCHTHWGSAWRERDGRDPRKWLDIVRSQGITHAVVLPELGLVHAGRIRQDHEDMAAVCAQSQGTMLPFATANIWVRDEALAEIHHALGALKFRGIKFHPWLQGCSPSHPVMDEVCELAAEYQVPILFHDGTPPFSLPSQIALLAQRHPRTTIVLGHCGLFEHWREAAAALHATPNLWGCLCSPHLAGLRGLLQRCDKSRLVWGTDFGYGLGDFYPYRIGIMDHVGWDAADHEQIMSQNARRLLNL